ncbi:MAG: glycosyltransferase [archaeon]
MNILMLNYEYPPLGGGAANACHYILQEYSRRPDIKVDLITSSPDNRRSMVRFSKNITIHKLNVHKKEIHVWRMQEIIRWTVSAYLLARKLMKKESYDICHCWFGWPGGIIGYLLRKDIPYIVALRGSDVPGYNPRLAILDSILFRPLSRLIWKHARAVIANSDGLKELAHRTSRRPIGVIFNGIDTEEFRPVRRPHKSFVILCVSRLIERKGIGYLLKAVSILDDVQVVIIGEGNREEQLKALSRKLFIENRVKFLGYVPHHKIRKHYNDADVFVLPSLNEGMSNTLLEAMACGLPLIVTNTGGTKELINGNGMIVRKKSVKDLVDSIKKLHDDRKLLGVLGKQSRTLAENMSWKKAAESYMELYDDSKK